MLKDKLKQVVAELNVPKNRYNTFGQYKYRSLEDILEAVKPLLEKHGLLLTINDEIVQVGDRYYVKATSTISDGNDELSVSAYAREPENKKGMDHAQLTGATSSYSRKYSLAGCFLLDDNVDPDTNEAHQMANNAKDAVNDDDKKWLSEGGDGKKSTTQSEFEKVEAKVKAGEVSPKALRQYYKVSKDTMSYFEGLL
jgi:hypothetical protein